MKNYTLFLSLLLLGTIASCKQEPSKETTETKISTEAPQSSGSSEAVYTADFILNDASGKSVGAFSTNPPKIQIGAKTYTAKEKEEKRKYYENGKLTYEIKMKDGGYKLRDADSKLLWKVKTYPDKIKVSDNEENTNPYEIRNNNGSIVIKKNDADYSTVKIEGKNILVNDKQAYILSKELDNFAVGILAIEEIPLDQRVFILAEYLIQKK